MAHLFATSLSLFDAIRWMALLPIIGFLAFDAALAASPDGPAGKLSRLAIRFNGMVPKHPLIRSISQSVAGMTLMFYVICALAICGLILAVKWWSMIRLPACQNKEIPHESAE